MKTKKYTLRGRVSRELDREIAEYVSSLELDKEIVEIDIDVLESHGIMLYKDGYLRRSEISLILSALESARKEVRKGSLKLDPRYVDIHPVLEKYVIESCGMEIAGKLYSGRSRNDQIATDLRVYLRNGNLTVLGNLLDLISVLLDLAEEHTLTVLPGYTHNQPAQAISFAHYLLSYSHAFLRDAERIFQNHARLNLNPLGGCAIAGTSFHLSREITTELLGFDGILENTIDATSNRDWILESVSDLTILMSTLSRMAKDLIFWSTYESGIIELEDKIVDISTAMPQKRNPIPLEIMIGKTEAMIGLLSQEFSIASSKMTGYGQYFQEMREPLSKIVETINSSLRVMKKVMKGLKVKKEKMYELAKKSDVTAIDLAEFLAMKGIPFREAHNSVGNLIKRLQKEGRNLSDITPDDLEIPVSEDELKKIVDPLLSIERREATSPAKIRREIRRARKEVERKRKLLASKNEKISVARSTLQKTVNELIG